MICTPNNISITYISISSYFTQKTKILGKKDCFFPLATYQKTEFVAAVLMLANYNATQTILCTLLKI